GIRLRSELSGALALLARRKGSTSFMTLLAAFQILLSRLSGQSEVSVGTPIAGRTRLETEGLIGFFVNTLVLRTHLSEDPPFQELLGRVRETALQAHAHQDVPFEKLVEELSPQRSLSYAPLFQVMFILQNAPRENLELPGLRMSTLGMDGGTAKFDLTLGLTEGGGGLSGSLEYSTDLFDGPTMGRWLEHFGTLLEGVVADPARPISELPLLNKAGRAQVLSEWNDTVRAVEERSLDELFAEQVARTPESIALVFEGELLSYRELDARAESLACHLEELGVGPEVGVALCAERSLELAIAMLAVLKTGGYYVPLDPEYPGDRLAYMLADSRARVLLLQPDLAGRLPEYRVPVVMLDGPWPVRAGRRARGAAGVGSRRLAYVIYTSGSTGRPKGVLVPHRGVVNRLSWAQRFYPLTLSDRVLQKASVSFDFSVWEVFGTLLTGARLVLAQPGGHRDGAYLARTVLEQEITLLHFVPSMLPMFLTAESVEQCRSLRYVFAGGEVLPLETRNLLFARLPCEVEALHNQYGPTEVSIDATTWVGRRGERAARSVPIGRPITNVSLYVLNDAFEPVPVGVAGELCIGGAGVVRGYLGHADRTAERFVPDPFGEPGARLYRTGDLGRWLPEGTLEFLGRRDHQVKVRGFRIELGEIESVLAQHGGVSEAVVLVREDEPGDRRLVGYVVAAFADRVPTAGALRSFLKETLPDYMVPSVWVFLERVPLTPSGKVDRRALPAPERDVARSAGWIAPRTWVEELLAQAWGEVLKVEGVGSEDDFFALGGHSLLATQVVSRVRRLFGVELALRELFEAPQLSALALRIEAALQAGGSTSAPPLERVHREEQVWLPLSFAQQRLWFIDQLEPGRPVYNMPVALRLEGGLRIDVLAAALEEIVRRHESLRTRFEVVDGEPGQVIDPPSPLRLPVVDLGSLNGSLRVTEARRLSREEARLPFDLGRGPLLRASLLRLGLEEHVFLATLHHIVSDGWSMGVLRRELGSLYRAFSAGEPSSLSELPLQYADYAAWQRGWLSGRVLEAEVSHWREQLAGAPPLLELPLDRPRPAVQSSRGAHQGIRLGSDLSGALAVLARREGSTSFMTLLAAFQVLLSRLSGQSEVSVGTPIAGRT
ncbi:amino acid adenylation domain-containing protein, partial [Hyalangium sp.]|uniref:amino acid adenylation domain-containing protein n=1 Tax=Hyalangium sp. TaxID=2028555 RepID=UPI002D734A53